MKQGFYDGLSIPEAIKIQNELRGKLRIEKLDTPIRTIGGADISLNPHSTTIYAGIVTLSYPEMRILSYSLIKAETTFEYVAGFLAFREVPALIDAWQQMEVKPDVLMMDGNGTVHPRRIGIAAHFGVLTGQPSMGCAKSILYGKHAEPAQERGASSIIYDGSEPIGYALRSKAKTLPVYISPGHLIGMEQSLDIAMHTMGKYRIPEPTRRAHEIVNRFRTGELTEGYHKV